MLLLLLLFRCKPPTLDWVKYYLWLSLGVKASTYIVNHEQEYYHGTIYKIHLGWNLVHIHKTIKFDAKGRTTRYKVYPNQLKRQKRVENFHLHSSYFWSLIFQPEFPVFLRKWYKVPLVSYAAVFCIVTQSSLERSVAWRHWVGN